jgi:hypothetical protein
MFLPFPNMPPRSYEIHFPGYGRREDVVVKPVSLLKVSKDTVSMLERERQKAMAEAAARKSAAKRKAAANGSSGGSGSTTPAGGKGGGSSGPAGKAPPSKRRKSASAGPSSSVSFNPQTA